MKWWDRARREEQERPPKRSVPARHGRHGRTGRGALTRPPLPAIGSRLDRFEMTVGAAATYLRDAWPDLANIRFEIASMPLHEGDGRTPRWYVDRANSRILIYRVPVERLSKAHGLPMHRTDENHRRILIESAVFGGAAEFLGKEPWELGADDFH